MGSGFEVLEHTADIGLRAWGGDLKEAFAAAAQGLFSIIAEPQEVGLREGRRVEVTAADLEGLLVGWLNELIYLFDAENLLLARFSIEELTPNRLVAEVWGEKADPSRHRVKLGVKAATRHMLQVEPGDGGYRLQVLFDI